MPASRKPQPKACEKIGLEGGLSGGTGSWPASPLSWHSRAEKSFGNNQLATNGSNSGEIMQSESQLSA